MINARDLYDNPSRTANSFKSFMIVDNLQYNGSVSLYNITNGSYLVNFNSSIGMMTNNHTEIYVLLLSNGSNKFENISNSPFSYYVEEVIPQSLGISIVNSSAGNVGFTIQFQGINVVNWQLSCPLLLNCVNWTIVDLSTNTTIPAEVEEIRCITSYQLNITCVVEYYTNFNVSSECRISSIRRIIDSTDVTSFHITTIECLLSEYICVWKSFEL